MAYSNLEIEIKIEVDKHNFEIAEKKLSKISTYKGTFKQIDTYYASKEKGYLGKEKYPYKWLSVRSRNEKTIINYKNYYPEGAEKHEYCDEYETEVSNLEMIDKILHSLGTQKIAVVEKVRKIYLFKDEFEVVLDTIKDLGFFIEVEALKDQGGISKTRLKIEEFISTLSINNYRTDYRGYPFLVYNKKK